MDYPLIFTFIKGFYLTVNYRRGGRDNNVWNMSKQDYDYFLKYSRSPGNDYYQEVFSDHNDSASDYVKYMTQIHKHMCFLLELFDRDYPELQLIQGYSFMNVCYVFGYLSVSGFGYSWNKHGCRALSYIFGIQGVEGEDKSSNYREFRNIVETLEDMGIKEDPEGREIYIFR